MQSELFAAISGTRTTSAGSWACVRRSRRTTPRVEEEWSDPHSTSSIFKDEGCSWMQLHLVTSPQTNVGVRHANRWCFGDVHSCHHSLLYKSMFICLSCQLLAWLFVIHCIGGPGAWQSAQEVSYNEFWNSYCLNEACNTSSFCFPSSSWAQSWEASCSHQREMGHIFLICLEPLGSSPSYEMSKTLSGPCF